MTAVQKHPSRQKAFALGLEPIAYRTNQTSIATSHGPEAYSGKFQLTLGSDSHSNDHNERRVPRAFSASDEAMSDHLTGSEKNQLPALQEAGSSSRHHGSRLGSSSPRSTFSGAERRASSSLISPDGKLGRRPINSGDPSLQHLAADALQAVVPAHSPSISLPQLTNDISIYTRKLSLRDEHLPTLSILSRDSARIKGEARSPPPPLLTPAGGELPPLQMDSPRSEGVGQSLPSIRSTFGDINRIPADLPPIENDTSRQPIQSTKCPGSPATSVPRLPPISASHVSPPISPNEAYHRNLPSPHSITSPGGPYGYPPSSNYDGYRTGSDGDTGNSPADSTPSHLSIDGIASGQVGSYVCTFDGCNAHPFQTQYLLNSHANVHSSARPHYCPVKGCPRSEGGKGFKRKNEMIRHGLVHDSPGYVCPFCPDREHKYPRPDNLQR